MVDDHVHGHGLESYELRGVGDVVERVPGTQDAHTGRVADNLLHLLDRRWPVQLLRPVRVIAGPVLSWRMILNHHFAPSPSCPSHGVGAVRAPQDRHGQDADGSSVVQPLYTGPKVVPRRSASDARETGAFC